LFIVKWKDDFGFASDGPAAFPTCIGAFRTFPTIYMPTVQNMGCMVVLHDIRTELAFHSFFPLFSIIRFAVGSDNVGQENEGNRVMGVGQLSSAMWACVMGLPPRCTFVASDMAA
jgi:hypothetical protein